MTPLIRCEDCGKEISDLAPACIHCGRPMHIVAVVPDTEEEDAHDWEEQLKERGQAILKRTGTAARAVGSKTRDLTAALGAHAKDLPSKVIERLIEDREVEVLVLPLGSGPADFLCALNLEVVLEDLASGILVRPKLSVWAHRDDLDRKQLAHKLEQEFSRQVTAFKARKQAGHDEEAKTDITAAKAARAKALKTKSGGWKTFWTASLAMLFFTNPILDAILLLVAVTGGVEGIADIFRTADADTEKRRAETKHVQLTKDLKREVRIKKRAFRTALGRMEISIHPQLLELAKDFADLDAAPGPIAAVIANIGPTVLPLLKSHQYRKQLPDWYDPLIEARLESWA